MNVFLHCLYDYKWGVIACQANNQRSSLFSLPSDDRRRHTREKEALDFFVLPLRADVMALFIPNTPRALTFITQTALFLCRYAPRTPAHDCKQDVSAHRAPGIGRPQSCAPRGSGSQTTTTTSDTRDFTCKWSDVKSLALNAPSLLCRKWFATKCGPVKYFMLSNTGYKTEHTLFFGNKDTELWIFGWFLLGLS